MNTNLDSYCDSDEEIFFGRMTLKEVKKAAFLGRVTAGKSSFKKNEDDSFKLIETKSEPNLLREYSPVESLTFMNDDDVRLDEVDDDLYDRFSSARSNWIHQVSDKSFEELERLVCSPEKAPDHLDTNAEGMDVECSPEESFGKTRSKIEYDLNNTFERMEHILKYGDKIINTPLNSDVNSNISEDFINAEPNVKINNNSHLTTLDNKKMKFFSTPEPSKVLVKSQNKRTGKSPFFKVPERSASRVPKPSFSIPAKTPPRSNLNFTSSASLQEIVSPIGYVIQHSPSVPKIKNVRPMKVLPVFNISEVVEQSDHKENIALPAKAYKPAKTMRLVDETAPTGLPKNNQVKKMVEKLGMPQVIRHQRREMLNESRLPLSTPSDNNSSGYYSVHSKTEDSFADLSMVNGDISVCVKKQAIRMLHGSKR